MLRCREAAGDTDPKHAEVHYVNSYWCDKYNANLW